MRRESFRKVVCEQVNVKLDRSEGHSPDRASCQRREGIEADRLEAQSYGHRR